MPPIGIKRTTISNSSDNSSSSVCVGKKRTKKISRKKSKIVLKNVNTGNSTGDISNVNKRPTHYNLLIYIAIYIPI